MNILKKLSDVMVESNCLGKLKVENDILIAFLKFDSNSPVFWNKIKYFENKSNKQGQLIKSIKFELYDEKVLNNNYDFVIIKKDNEIYYLYRKLENFQIKREPKTIGYPDKESLILLDIDLEWNCHVLTSRKIIDRLFFKNEPVVLDFRNEQYQDNCKINLEDYLAGDFSKLMT